MYARKCGFWRHSGDIPQFLQIEDKKAGSLLVIDGTSTQVHVHVLIHRTVAWSCGVDGGTWLMWSQVKKTELPLDFYEAPSLQSSVATQDCTQSRINVHFVAASFLHCRSNKLNARGTLFFPQGARILQRLSADPAGTTVYNYLDNDQVAAKKTTH